LLLSRRRFELRMGSRKIIVCLGVGLLLCGSLSIMRPVMGVEEVAASLREGLQLSPSRIEDVGPSLGAHGVTAGEVEEAAASSREGLQLSPSRIEDVSPSLGAHSVTAGESSHVGVESADRSTSALLVKLEDTVQKVLNAWHPASVRAGEWSEDHRLMSEVFWNHVAPSLGKKYSQLRKLLDAGAFKLIHRVMSQRAYYITEATEPEKRLIDKSWAALLERWQSASSREGAGADVGAERGRAKRILEMMDVMAARVRSSQQPATEKTDPLDYIKAVSHDLVKESWAGLQPLLIGDDDHQAQLNSLVSSSCQAIHDSLNELADALKNLPQDSVPQHHHTAFFYDEVRNKFKKQDPTLTFQVLRNHS